MGENHNPVFRYVDVRLDGVGPDVDGPPETGHGVLRECCFVPSVSDTLGFAIFCEDELSLIMVSISGYATSWEQRQNTW